MLNKKYKSKTFNNKYRIKNGQPKEEEKQGQEQERKGPIHEPVAVSRSFLNTPTTSNFVDNSYSQMTRNLNECRSSSMPPSAVMLSPKKADSPKQGNQM